MSIYTPNLDNFTAVYFIAPIDNYELEIVSLSCQLSKEFTDPQSQMKVQKPIVSVTFRISSGQTSNEYNGKPVTKQFWLGDKEDDWNQLLKFVGAAKGIKFGTPEADEQFRQLMATSDLSVDAENKKLGTAYEGLKGARVRSSLSTRFDKKDLSKQYQDFGTFTPMV